MFYFVIIGGKIWLKDNSYTKIEIQIIAIMKFIREWILILYYKINDVEKGNKYGVYG